MKYIIYNTSLAFLLFISVIWGQKNVKTVLSKQQTFIDSVAVILEIEADSIAKYPELLNLTKKLKDRLFNFYKKSDDPKVIKLSILMANKLAAIYDVQEKWDSVIKIQTAIEPVKLNISDSILGKHYYLLADAYLEKSEYLKAEQAYLKALKYFKRAGIQQTAATIYSNLGVLYDELGKIPEAIKYYFKALNIFHKFKDKKAVAKLYNNIGYVYRRQEDFDKALEFFNKSLKIKQELQDSFSIAFTYNNIGGVYFAMKKYDKAIKYYETVLDIFKKLNYKDGIAVILNNIAYVYVRKGEPKKALKYALKALKIQEKSKNKLALIQPYVTLSSIYDALNQHEKALFYAQKAYEIANKTETKTLIKATSYNLYNIYKHSGNYKKALEMLEMSEALEDSIMNAQNKRKLMEKEIAFEYEKQKAINEIKHKAELQKQKALAQEQRKKQTIIIAFIAFILVIVSGFSIVIYGKLQVIKQQKQQIEYQNMELLQKNEEILIQNEQLETQKREIAQKNVELNQMNENLNQLNEELKQMNYELTLAKRKIEEMLKDLTMSITVAARIQKALLAHSNPFLEYLPPHFIIYKPKDIVSGDFYWIRKIENKTLVAVADCTGHGVPAAMLSIIGIQILDNLLKQNITQPDQILNKLREKIIETLSSRKGYEHSQEGMDMTIISFEQNSNTIYWAGANNSLYVITKKPEELKNTENAKSLTQNNTTLIELKADKQPVGPYAQIKDFTLRKTKINPGDEIVLFSDGLKDLPGGETCKKLKAKGFKKLLIRAYELPANKQKDFITQVIKQWQGNCPQYDDITLLGIKF